MNAWQSIWDRLNPIERRAAATSYLSASESVPMARDSAIAVIAREMRTRPKTVAGWPLEFRADRLARLTRLDPPFAAALVASFFVQCRKPLVTRFLDVAQLPHDDGALRQSALATPCSLERLVAAVAAIRGEFASRDVDLYLDALEAQHLPCLSDLAAARGGAAPPSSAACGGR